MASTDADTTIQPMHIVIPGALPPASVAGELSRMMGQHSPALVRLFERWVPRVVSLHPAQTGCTPAEYCMLEQLGWVSETPSRAVGALAAMQTQTTAHDETAWIAQMCAISIGNEQVSLAIPEELELSIAESKQLLNDVLAHTPPSGFTLAPIDNQQVAHAWRVTFDEAIQYASISPRAVSGLGVTDWLPQDPSTRCWRKWLNEAQMTWHNHPINQDRTNRGLMPINGLWLYGGGSGWTLQTPDTRTLTLPHLERSHAKGDWSEWIRALSTLDQALTQQEQVSRVSLLGDARMVVLADAERKWWSKLFSSSKQPWSRWWNPPA